MANGLFGGGTGTSENPYLVEDAQDLNAIRNNLNAYYKQVADIDLVDWENWEPIGSNSNQLTGGYNGNGHIINNLTFKSDIQEVVGLFASIAGEVRNLGVVNVDIIGKNVIGAITGSMLESSKMENCYATGKVEGDKSVGGLVGNALTNTRITKCYSQCIVIGTEKVGGIAGELYSSGSYNSSRLTGSVMLGAYVARRSGTATTFGSLAGYLVGSYISDCHSIDTLEFRQL